MYINLSQAPILTPHKKIDILLDDLKTGPIERFLTFCQVLYTEGQGHLLQIMGVDIREIEEQKSKYVSDTCKIKLISPVQVSYLNSVASMSHA